MILLISSQMKDEQTKIEIKIFVAFDTEVCYGRNRGNNAFDKKFRNNFFTHRQG